MEMLNKVELTGKVGNVRIVNVVDTRVAHLSIATDYIYTNKDGYQTIETTWHYVDIWEKPDGPSLDDIKKGAAINVKGRLRNRKYISFAGEEVIRTEIVAYAWKVVE